MLMNAPILQLKNIRKDFGEGEVLKGIDMSVMPGEFLTLLGPSGCGKTTTLRIIAGLEVPSFGRVLLDGNDITELPPEKRAVNTVFQNYALFPHMNVEQNIAYGLKLRKLPREAVKREVQKMLELVQLSGFEKRMPSQLSGGQRQRVAIARAVVLAPRILLLDEPLGALDLQLRRQMQQELKKLQQQLGITFIYITHDQEEALNMSDRIAIMNEGQFEQIGTPEEIYERPKTRFAAQFIGQGSLLRGVADECTKEAISVKLASGCALAAPNAEVRKGEQVWLSVHSERIRYSSEIQPGFTLTAKVLSNHYSGSMLKTDLELQTGEKLTAFGMDTVEALPKVGSSVHVYWAAHHAALVPDGEKP